MTRLWNDGDAAIPPDYLSDKPTFNPAKNDHWSSIGCWPAQLLSPYTAGSEEQTRSQDADIGRDAE